MKLNIKISELKQAVEFAQKIVSQRSALPILSMLKLAAKQNQLTVSGTNLDSDFFATAQAEVSEPGEMVISARQLAMICQQGYLATIATTEKGGILILVDGCEYKTPAIEPKDFPPGLNSKDATSLCEVDGIRFAEALRKAAPFMSTDECHYALNCVFVEAKESQVLIVATDGRTLFIESLARKLGEIGQFTIISNVVNQIKDVIFPANVQLFWPRVGKTSLDNIAIQSANFGVVAKQTGFNFPKYSQVIPPEEKTIVKFKAKREDLLKAVKQVAVACVGDDVSVKLAIEDNQLTVSAGRAIDELKAVLTCKVAPILSYAKPFEASFNHQYLIRAISVMDETFTASFSSEINPAVLQSQNTQVVVMPMRIV